MKQFQTFFYILTLMFLSACDGDSLNGTKEEASIDDTSTIVVSVSIDKQQIDVNNPAIVSAKVTNNGSTVEGAVVKFESDLGVFDIESSSALTNAEGIATIGLTAGSTQGAATVTASVDSGESGSASFSTEGDGIDDSGERELDQKIILITISEPNISASSAAIVTANIKTIDGVSAGEVVTFSTDLGYLYPSSGTALTNSDGNAQILINADDIRGAGTVTATTSTGETSTISFASAGDGGLAAGKQVELSISKIAVTQESPSILSVTVTDENGPLIGEVVNFSSSLGVFTPVSGTALTDENGMANIILTAGNIEGAALATARISSGEMDSIGFFTAGDASSIAGKSVAITISDVAVNESSPATLTANVTNAGLPVAGEVVNFSSTLGSLSNPSGTALTNVDGIATIVLTAGSSAGAGVASATIDNGATAKVGFSTEGDESTQMGKTIVVTPISSVVENATPVTVTIKVTDIGVGVANEVINFTTTLGAFNPQSGTALTNANGEATIELTAGSIEGAGIVTATLSTGEFDTSGFATKGDGSEAGGIVVELSPITAPVTHAAPTKVMVMVTDNGESLPNQVVNFASTLGVFDPVSASALTDENGKAEIDLTAGSVVGAGLLTATLSSGELDTIGFETAGDAPVVQGKQVSIVISDKSIDGTMATTVVATVTDNGVAVANEVVNFASTLGLLDPVSGTALTVDDGFGNITATITLSAGTVKGAGVVTATLSNGATASDSFATEGDEIIGAYIELRIVDKDSDTPIDTINTTISGKIIATVYGLAVGERSLVTFSSDIGEIPIPTAITDSTTNQAFVDIYAGNDIGAGTITASLSNGVTAKELIIVGAAGLGIGSVTPGIVLPDMLSAGGSTNITVTIIDTNNSDAPYIEPLLVNFSSSCSLDGKAVLDEEVITFQGTAISSYLAAGCQGTDTITVTVNAGSEILSTTVEIGILSADVGSIEFVSVSNENLALKGAGTSDNPEYSTVIFRVLDVNGLPSENEKVDFSLNTNAGGITLNPPQGETNLDGYVQVVVNSGTISTPVRVTASVNLSVPLISTQSSLMVISTGIPDQDSFSLSADVYNIEGYSIDGTVANITARLADGFNNPVPDGTAVSFTAEGGVIQPSCTTLDGVCSVEFRSSNPRPLDSRVTIMAHAVGEESFPDLNGNGRFDFEEHDEFLLPSIIDGKAYDLAETFVDNNENGSRDVGEEFFDFVDPNNGTVGVYDPADNAYNGSLCSDPSIVQCADQKSIHVRGDLVIVLSGSAGSAIVTKDLTVDSPADNNDDVVSITGENIGFARVLITGPSGQPLPAETIIEFITSAGTLVGENEFIWPSENEVGRTFSVEIEGDTEPKLGSLSVKITTPSGNSVVYPTGISIEIL